MEAIVESPATEIAGRSVLLTVVTIHALSLYFEYQNINHHLNMTFQETLGEV